MNWKGFLKPDWRKISMLFILEFFLTFIALLFGFKLPIWAVYLIAPNVLYLETTVTSLFTSPVELSLHGTVSNVIVLFYRYILSCLIIWIYDKVRK